MKKTWFASLVLTTLMAVNATSTAWASVVVAGTRVIYPADSRDVSVRVTNNGEIPALVQSWVDAGDVSIKIEDLDVPFTISPSVYRLDPSKTQVMRLVFLGAQLPKDRETVYWLNVLEIPPKPTGNTAAENYLQFAIKSRIKIFYRPTGLPGTPADAPQALRWSVQSAEGGEVRVKVENPSAFHVSFSEVRAAGTNGAMTDAMNGMVLPKASLQFNFKASGLVPNAPVRVQFKTVNDYGAFVDGTAELR